MPKGRLGLFVVLGGCRLVDILIVLLIVLLVLSLGGGWWTSRPGWSGPDVSGFVWVLFAVVLIVVVFRALGVL